MTELHEAGDPLCELHHVLDGVRDLDGTLLPQRFPGLQDRGHGLCTEQRSTWKASESQGFPTGAYLPLGAQGPLYPIPLKEADNIF